MKNRKQRSFQPTRFQRRNRQGAALVDFAIAAPLFFALIFTAFEITRVNQLRNTAEIAATEGARRGIIPGASAAECVAVATAEMTAVGTTQFTVAVTPTAIAANTPTVEVSVTVPLDVRNGYFLTNLFAGGRITKSITLERER